jgi:hypothetical protein
MDAMNICFTLIGGLVGYYMSRVSVAGVASKAIDIYVDLKWALFPPTVKQESEENKPAAEPVRLKWISETPYYRMYELNDKMYITFNSKYEPSSANSNSNANACEEHTLENIIVIKTDGSKADPSPLLIETLAKCGGYGNTYKSGVPTLEQLRMLPSDGLKQELKDVKKIIINTSLEEHIIV